MKKYFVFLLPLCFFGRPAEAQQLQPAPWNNPAIIWLTPEQAQTKLQTELQQIQPPLSGLTPGTPAHTDLLRRIIFYKAMLRNLLYGATVQNAIAAGLPEAASMDGLYEQSFTPEATLRALFEDALALLAT